MCHAYSIVESSDKGLELPHRELEWGMSDKMEI